MSEPLRQRRPSLFVGRTHELDELRRGLGDAIDGEGRLFLLTGEPGIGKTRLADELARLATTQGAQVLWGRCWESGGAPAFWPWVQILRACRRDLDATVVDPVWRAHATDLAELVPDAATAVAPNESALADPDQARFRLFDAATVVLRAVSRHTPLVLILEDLHTADQPSLMLLRFLGRELRGARLLVVGTYRGLEAAREPAVSRILAEVCREGTQIALRGLSRDDVADYLARTDTAADPQLVEVLYSRTEGNPLFLSEVARLVDRDSGGQHGANVRVPEHVRAVIRERFASLSAATREILSVAAVIGREFEVPVLEALLEPRASAVRPALEEAGAAAVIGRLPNTLARWTFSHVLLRDTLYEDISAEERAQVHRRIGAALEVFYAGDLQPHLAEVAHHFVLGAEAESSDAALDYAQRAGQRAQSLLAYEEAVSHFERTLQVLDLRRAVARPGDARRRVELQLCLGDALWGVRDLTRMRATFARAAEVARTLPKQEGAPLVATAALGFGGRQQRAHLVFEQPVVDLLEEALRLLPAEDSPLRARVLARLAYALYSQVGSYDRRVELCTEAVAMARRLNDVPTLRWVMNDWRWALWGPDRIEERMRIAAELVALAERSGDWETSMNEHAWRLVDLLEVGDVAAVDAEFDIYTRSARQLRQPWYEEYIARFGAMRALLEGRFDEAERLANDALAQAQRVQHADAALVYGTQMLGLRIEQGRLSEMESGLQAMVAQYPAVPIWRSVAAFLHVEQGRADEARLELDRITRGGLADLPRDYLRVPALSYLADVAVGLADRRRATLVYDLLLPYAGRSVVVGFGVVCLGAVTSYLARLAVTLERWQEATEHFTAALRQNERLRAFPALAKTRFAYAKMLLAIGERDAARSLAAEACSAAEAFGMHGLAERAAALRAEIGEPGAATAEPPAANAKGAASAPPAVFRRQGDVWSLSFDGVSVQLKDLMGFTYLAHLLRYPEREFHVLDLVSLVSGDREEGDSVAFAGDAGEVLDQRAMSNYRERIRELRSELAEAEEINDLGRAAQLRAELDILTDELTRATGLGGRSRRTGSVAERARVNVTKRVGIALRRIGAHHEGMARYLSQTITTGTFCSYNPDPRRPVQWEL